MRLKSKCNGCHRKLEIEGEAGVGSVVCPVCGGTIRLPQTILEQGEEIGDFKINRHIGSGSMGDVYLATQMSMERDVAIKFLPPDIGEDQESVENFMAEVRTLAKLDHHNIVTAFQAGESNGLYFLAMTYVDGGSLEDRLEAKGPLSEEEALYICLRVAQALRYAWDRFQIIHRDIKPENIMMHTAQKEPKILDLGISKIIGDDSRIHSESGILVGTPYYMSPEQAQASENVDFRADMYSLGCTLFRLVTGKVPFEAKDPMAVLMQHVTAPIPNPSIHTPDLHVATVELIEQLMAKAADDRFDNWTELIDTIKGVLSAVKSPNTEYNTNTRPLPRRKTSLAMANMTEVLEDDDGELFEDKPSKVPLILLILLSVLVLFGLGGIIGLEAFKRRASKDNAPPEPTNPILEVHSLDDRQGQTPSSIEAVKHLEAEEKSKSPQNTDELSTRVTNALSVKPTQIKEINQQISIIEALLRDAAGTTYMTTLQARLKELKIQRVLTSLEDKAEDFYKAGDFKQANRLLRNYKGPYANITEKQRLEIIRKLWRKHKARPRKKQ